MLKTLDKRAKRANIAHFQKNLKLQISTIFGCENNLSIRSIPPNETNTVIKALKNKKSSDYDKIFTKEGHNFFDVDI